MVQFLNRQICQIKRTCGNVVLHRQCLGVQYPLIHLLLCVISCSALLCVLYYTHLYQLISLPTLSPLPTLRVPLSVTHILFNTHFSQENLFLPGNSEEFFLFQKLEFSFINFNSMQIFAINLSVTF